MRAAKLAGIAIAIVIAAFVAFEAYAVGRAQQRTPAVLAAMSRGQLDLSDLPKRRVDMLLKIGDPNFYHHRGVDFSTPGAGMTTITQALVKRFYFEHFRPGFPKIEQSLIARFVLDRTATKEQQLKAYLNFTYFGHRNGRPIIGFDDAARAYYRKSLARLSDAEYLSLVAMLVAPKQLDPARHKQANAQRVRRIEAMLAGKCAPAGLRDVRYEACASVAR